MKDDSDPLMPFWRFDSDPKIADPKIGGAARVSQKTRTLAGPVKANEGSEISQTVRLLHRSPNLGFRAV